MKRILLVLAALFSPLALAAPHIACDVDQRATHTQIQVCSTVNTNTTPASCTTWGSWSVDVATVPGTPETCLHDIAAVPVGVNIVRVKAIDVAGWGGREESPASAPFVFTRPPGMAAPAVIRIVP